jgi:hypothetical protein
MKKWLVRIVFVFALLLLGLIIFVVIDENDKAVIESYAKNENLPVVKAGWRGVPVDRKGRFVNHEHP